MEFYICTDLNIQIINQIIQELSGIEGSREEILFDLTHTGFVDSFASTFLALLANELATERPVRFNLSPKNPNLFYLSRIGFFRELTRSITVEPLSASNPSFVENHRGKKDTILEVTSLKEFGISYIIKRILNTLTQTLHCGPEFSRDICVLVSELLHNIVDHSKKSETGLISLQAYLRAGKAKLAVVDSGIGILASLQENHSATLNSDIDALTLSLKRGISRFPDQNRGVGLSTCTELTGSYKGELYIRSGAGQVIVKRGRIIAANVSAFKGTQVSITIPFNY